MFPLNQSSDIHFVLPCLIRSASSFGHHHNIFFRWRLCSGETVGSSIYSGFTPPSKIWWDLRVRVSIGFLILGMILKCWSNVWSGWIFSGSFLCYVYDFISLIPSCSFILSVDAPICVCYLFVRHVYINLVRIIAITEWN